VEYSGPPELFARTDAPAGSTTFRKRQRPGRTSCTQSPSSDFDSCTPISLSTEWMWEGTIPYALKRPEESAMATAMVSAWTSGPTYLTLHCVGDGVIWTSSGLDDGGIRPATILWLWRPPMRLLTHVRSVRHPHSA